MSTDDELNTLLSDQKTLAQAIGASAAICSSGGGNTLTIFELEVRLELLEVNWKRFQENNLVLQRQAARMSDRSYFKSNVADTTLTTYMRCKSWFKSRLAALAPQPTTSAPPPPRVQREADQAAIIRNQTPLQCVKIPTFTGIQRDWESYKEQFEELVVNDEAMAPIVKYRRLMDSLSGEALTTLLGIKALSKNFSTAWTTLCEKYDNKPLRFLLQMQTLDKLPAATKESAHHL